MRLAVVAGTCAPAPWSHLILFWEQEQHTRPPAGPWPGIEFTLLNAGQDDLKRLLTSLPNSRHLTWADFSSVTAQHRRDPASPRCQTLCVQLPREAGRRPLFSFVITSSLSSFIPLLSSPFSLFFSFAAFYVFLPVFLPLQPSRSCCTFPR